MTSDVWRGTVSPTIPYHTSDVSPSPCVMSLRTKVASCPLWLIMIGDDDDDDDDWYVVVTAGSRLADYLKL